VLCFGLCGGRGVREISFFAKPAVFLGPSERYPYPRLQRGSSMIRGEQMAQYMGAKLNPETDYEGDLRIYVKPSTLDDIPDGSYIDMLEEVGFIPMLEERPGLHVIVLSQAGKEFLEKRIGNQVVVIPQHHCNLEGFARGRKEITTVGVIGSRDSFDDPTGQFKDQAKEIGLEFSVCNSFRSRMEVCDFYKRIDIQVSWNTDVTRQKLFRDSLRIKNAASFGIPTVAFPEIPMKEFKGSYLQVETKKDLVGEVERLKEKDYYWMWSEKAIKAAEAFHIGNIAQKYLELV
jgi:hypothetical protein